MAKLFVVAALCLLAGGVVGSFVTRSVYGIAPVAVDPSPPGSALCPKCRECPICPAPVDCGEQGLVPDDDTFDDDRIIDTPERPTDGLPGLPASALGLATAAVKVAIAPCLEEPGEPGHVLLSLTVTATGGAGFIRSAELRKLPDEEIGARADCVVRAAKRARFEYADGEGQLRFQLPVKLP